MKRPDGGDQGTSRDTGTPSEGLAGKPREIGAYMRHAREDIDASREMFENGRLRHAVFFANQALELCVKAYMLRYKIIDEAAESKHYPYPKVVQTMRETTERSAEFGMLAEKQKQPAFKIVETFNEMFSDVVKDKKLRIIIWKKSLNMSLSDDEITHFKSWTAKSSALGPAISRAERTQQKIMQEQGSVAYTTHEADRFFAAVLKEFLTDTKQRENATSMLLPGGNAIPTDAALALGRMLALIELFVYLWTIVKGFVHQQISRYPTDIDGVDSGDVYRQRGNDVKNLLAEIHAVSKKLMDHLEGGSPLQVQGMATLVGELVGGGGTPNGVDTETALAHILDDHLLDGSAPPDIESALQTAMARLRGSGAAGGTAGSEGRGNRKGGGRS